MKSWAGNNTNKPTVEIYNIMGQLIYQNTLSDTEITITLQVAEGIYGVKIVSQDDKMVMKKILISK